MVVETLVELARKGHRYEIEMTTPKGQRHDEENCDACIAIKYAVRQLDNARNMGGDVVLYIP